MPDLIDSTPDAAQAAPRIFFSIIVPVWNARAFVGECIDSIRSQTFPSWECLITDDASGDGTWEAVVDRAGGDSRFRLFHNEERKTALPNLMQMIRDARGDYIFILDGDDWLVHNHVLDVVYRVYEDAPAVIATSGSYFLAWHSGAAAGEGTRGHARKVAQDEEWFQTWPFGHPLTFMRRYSIESMDTEPEAYLDVSTGKPYTSTYDLALYYPIAARADWYGKRIAHINDLLYAYRRHDLNDDIVNVQLQSLCARKIQLYWLNKMWERDRKVSQ